MITKYNKLVRDNIPKIIEQNGGKPTYHRILNDAEYKDALKHKLIEEFNELMAAGTEEEELEELADILEVILTMAMAEPQILKIAVEKQESRGSFSGRIFLENAKERAKS